MNSHHYEFDIRNVLPLSALPIATVLAFALLMHIGVSLAWWPAPKPTLNVDRTILTHQAFSASAPQQAELLLIGDSSCLMDVSAFRLGELLGRQTAVLNLGTVSYLDLEDYAQLLTRYTQTNPGRLKTIVLLMHPEALRRAQPNPLHVELLRHALAGTDTCETSSAQEKAACWLGLEIFRGRFLGRAIPTPLPGQFGARYGFSSGLWNEMTANNGSAIDPASAAPAGRRINTQYRLSARLRESSRVFRAAVPRGVRLIAGITPCAESFVAPGHGDTILRMLNEWGVFLQADKRIEGLPAVLPDDHFARPASADANPVHLNERGNEAYTKRLAELLAAYGL